MLFLNIGPVIGSTLYSAGGFGLPFWVIGSIAFIVGLYLIVALPKFHHKDAPDVESEELLAEKVDSGKTLNIIDILKV